MKFINKKTIKLDKVLNELDKFVIRFIKILEKHTPYVIVSGYVAILLGRNRGTDDIDIFVNELNKEKFNALYKDLKNNGYWCLNSDNISEMHSYLNEGLALRFAIKNQTTPNFEVKFARKRLDKEALLDKISVIIQNHKINISSLERQIAFKKYYLKSDKDLEDAKHIETLFKENLDLSRINEYKRLLHNEMAKTWKG